MPKLSIEQVKQIKRRIFKGETQVSIAKDYPVGSAQIGRIERGEDWEEVRNIQNTNDILYGFFNELTALNNICSTEKNMSLQYYASRVSSISEKYAKKIYPEKGN